MSTQTRAAGRGFLANMKISRQIALIGIVGLLGLLTAAGIMFTSNTIINRMMDVQNVDFEAMNAAVETRGGINNVYRLESQFLRTKHTETARQISDEIKTVDDNLAKLQDGKNRK